MEERSLSRQVVIVWRLRGTLLAVAAAFLCGALAVFSRTLALLCASFGGAAYLLFMVWYCKARFESTTYALLPGVLLLRCGVFFQKEIRLEFARTQFCELMRSPAERALGLAGLTLHAAGARLRLDGLEVNEALAVRRRILEGAKDEI